MEFSWRYRGSWTFWTKRKRDCTQWIREERDNVWDNTVLRCFSYSFYCDFTAALSWPHKKKSAMKCQKFAIKVLYFSTFLYFPSFRLGSVFCWEVRRHLKSILLPTLDTARYVLSTSRKHESLSRKRTLLLIRMMESGTTAVPKIAHNYVSRVKKREKCMLNAATY